MKHENVNHNYSINRHYLLLLVISQVIIGISIPCEAFAHNSSTITIRVARQPITLDGNISSTEWEDASKTNFTSPRINEGYVLVYLKYELFDKALDGAFYIPDKTPSFNKDHPDQISFNFDVNHDALNKPNSDDSFIVFLRDKTAQYYKGDNSKEIFKSIENSTKPQGPLSTLTAPFSKVDFHTVSNNKNYWSGEFKIYFKTDPQKYGFSIQQSDSYTDGKGKLNYFFINYPLATVTQADKPSTWADIDFFGVSQYAVNIKKFCSNNLSITPNNIDVLCIKSTQPPSVEEKVPADVIIEGVLGNLINGTGVKDQMISTYVVNSKGNAVSDKQNIPTSEDGHFVSTIKGVKLGADDTYRVFANPISGFFGLNATSDLIVTRHTLTAGEFVATLGTYFGVIAGGIGLLALLPRLKKYLTERKQREILYRYISEINQIYYSHSSSTANKELGANKLKEKRNQILDSFYNGEISEEHFGMLDGKISEYEHKFQNL